LWWTELLPVEGAVVLILLLQQRSSIEMDFYSLADLIERVDAVKERKQMVLDKLFMINIPLEAQCKLADRLNEYAKAEEARAIGELVACLGPEAYSSESSESEQDYDRYSVMCPFDDLTHPFLFSWF
jgi:hypothetical protein